MTLGVTPDRPETGYGYVVAKPPARLVAGRPTFDVERFVEKPTAEYAAQLIATGLASWNAGTFAWTRATIRDRLARHAPEIVGPIRAICASGTPADLDAAYPSIRATSIDYAVMEPASLEGGVAVVPMAVGWSDIGSWAALRDLWQAAAASARTAESAAGAVGRGNRRDLGSTQTLVLAGDRLVVTIGLSDTIVIDTPEALLVCSAERSQEVRGIARGTDELEPDAGSRGGEAVSPTSAAAEPTHIVFGTDGWRARIADDFNFTNVRRCAQAVAEYVVDRGDQNRGIVFAYDRRFASEHFATAAAEVVLAHGIPIVFATQAVPTQMSSFEVVQRRSAAGIVITAKSQPLDRQRLQDQVTDGRRSRARDARRHRSPDRRRRRECHRNPSFRGRRGSRAGREVRPLRRLPGVHRPEPRPGPPPGCRDGPSRRPALRLGIDLDPAPPGRRPHSRQGDPLRTQPVLRRRQPGAHPAERERGPGGYRRTVMRTWGCSWTATRTGPGQPTSGASSSPLCRSSPCSCTTSSSTAACASRW